MSPLLDAFLSLTASFYSPCFPCRSLCFYACLSLPSLSLYHFSFLPTSPLLLLYFHASFLPLPASFILFLLSLSLFLPLFLSFFHFPSLLSPFSFLPASPSLSSACPCLIFTSPSLSSLLPLFLVSPSASFPVSLCLFSSVVFVVSSFLCFSVPLFVPLPLHLPSF